jgi:hypothetical protein
MHISSQAFLDIIAHKIPSYMDSLYGRHPPRNPDCVPAFTRYLLCTLYDPDTG